MKFNANSAATEPERIPSSIGAINRLPEAEKRAIYLRAVPPALLERFGLSPYLVDAEGRPLFTLRAPAGASTPSNGGKWKSPGSLPGPSFPPINRKGGDSRRRPVREAEAFRPCFPGGKGVSGLQGMRGSGQEPGERGPGGIPRGRRGFSPLRSLFPPWFEGVFARILRRHVRKR